MRALDPHAQQKPVLGAQLNWAHPLAQGLTGLWLLSDFGATAFDATGNNSFALTAPTWVTGTHGAALSLNGTNSSGSAGSPRNLGLSGNNPYTMAVWVNPSATRLDGAFLSYGPAATKQVACISSDGAAHIMSVHFSDDHSYAKTYALNTWQHVVIAYDGATEWMYYNGALSESWSAGSLLLAAGQAFRLGISTWNGVNAAACLLDSAGIWSRALAPAEVAQLYAEPFAMMQQPTYRRWFVVAGGGTTHLVTASVVQASAAGVTKIDVALRATTQTSVATAQRTDALARAVQAASSSAVQRATAHLALLTQNSAPSVQRTDAAARGATTGGVAALSKTLVTRRGVAQASVAALGKSISALRSTVQASVAALGKSSNALRSTVQASVAALGKSSNALRSTVQASVAAVTFGAHTYTITAAVVTASVAALKNTTTARRGVAQASAAGATRSATAVRGVAQSSIAGTARAVTAVRGVAQTSIATLLGLPSGLIGAARAVYHLIARALSFALVARAYAFVLPAGEESMMAVPTDPTKAALIGKHEVEQVYSLDLTNGLNGELPASANPVQPMVLQVKHGQQTTDVSAQKLRSWSLSLTAPYVLTFVIGDGNQLPGYTYLAGAYVTTASGRVFEGYIAIPCVVEPGL